MTSAAPSGRIRAARRRALGTALLLRDRPFSDDLWAGDVEIVSFESYDEAEIALEAFVDELSADLRARLATFSTTRFRVW